MRFEMAAAFDSDMPYDRVLEVLGAETDWPWHDRRAEGWGCFV